MIYKLDNSSGTPKLIPLSQGDMHLNGNKNSNSEHINNTEYNELNNHYIVRGNPFKTEITPAYGIYFTDKSVYDKEIQDLTRLDDGVTLEELRAERQKIDTMSGDVLVFILILFFCIISGIVGGLIGRRRKIGAVWSFVLGLFLSVIGWIIVASSEKEPEFIEISNKEK